MNSLLKHLQKGIAKKIKKGLNLKKRINQKGYKLCVQWKGYNNSLIIGLIKKT